MSLMSPAKIVRLGRYDFPDPKEVKGILVVRAVLTPQVFERAVWGSDVLRLLIGDKDEMQRVLGKELQPAVTSSDQEVIRRISTLYADYLAGIRAAIAEDLGYRAACFTRLIVTERMVFVTDKGAYWRSFATHDELFIDLDMRSREIWRELSKVGYPLLRQGS
jgi:hypothetical protein